MSVFTNPVKGAAEHATAYVKAVLDLLGDRDPIAVLRETPLLLPRAIEGLSRQLLRKPRATRQMVDCPGPSASRRLRNRVRLAHSANPRGGSTTADRL
jgi:hypothetical protein